MKIGFPELFLLVQYVLAAFGKVPSWHCLPTIVVVAFLYLYEEGKKAREASAADAVRLARRTPPPPAILQPRHTRSTHDH